MSKTPAVAEAQQMQPSENSRGSMSPDDETLSRDDWLTRLLQIMTASEGTAIAVFSGKLLDGRSAKRR